MRLRLTILVLVCGLAALSACGVQAPGTPSPSVQQIVERVQDAALGTPHTGLRRVEARYEVAGLIYEVAYTERIWCDGTGKFAIVPVDVLTPVQPDPVTFALIQERRAGFLFRYRDFRIRDFQSFAHNYAIPSLGQPVSIAGRPCVELPIARKVSGSVRYLVAVDLDTGLILRCTELDEHGDVVASMEYLSLDLAPDFSGVVWHTPGNQEAPVDLASPTLAAELGFEPFKPRVVPRGYRLAGVTRVVDGTGRPWLKLEYCDGVEALLFLDGGPSAAATVSTAKSGYGVAGVDDKVILFQAGPARILQGRVRGQELIAVGKVSADDLLVLVDSSLP